MMSPKQRTENNNKHAVGTREEYEIIVKMRLENRDQSTKYADQLNNECSMWKQELWNLLPYIWNTKQICNE